MTQELVTTITLNGREISRKAPGHFTLLRWLREVAGVYDVKYGCGEGVCGACTVLVDGRAISSCLAPAARYDGCTVQTASGLLENGQLNDLQQAFLAHGAAQCGFCTPGMLLAATELLASIPESVPPTVASSTVASGFNPTHAGNPEADSTDDIPPNPALDEQRIREALHGNLCRCTGYGPIISAVRAVAEARRR